MLALALGLVVATGCAGKKRDFGPALDLEEEAQEGSSGETGAPVQASAGAGGMANSESQPLPTLAAPVDGGASASSTSAAVEPCGDACSGECEPGDTQCTSPTERIECGIDALWSEPVACPSVCIDGSCTGECSPASTECVTTTRFRECSELGVWSEATDCANACVGAACGGECRPGQTRCASTTSAQVCNEQGQWGAIAACQNACVGSACTGECVPAATRCSSETQLQTCNEQGQFLAGAICPFACVNGSCGGECSPGSRRCNPGTGVPQFCSSSGIWQSQAPCPFVCSGGGTCGGECVPGSRRCSPVSGLPQLCGEAGSWQNQGACRFACLGDGSCGGECVPGSRRCATGVPQLCSEAGSWQNQATCPFTCSNGFCGGECSPGDRRCAPQSGIPQLCSSTGTWQDEQSCGGAVCQGGECVCGANQTLCTDGTSITCSNTTFGFEDGNLQGWAARGLGSGLDACGDRFSSCLIAFDVNDLPGSARTGQFFASARFLMNTASANRRVAIDARLCGARGSGARSTTNLAGKTITAYMNTGSQGGSFAGNVYAISISDGVATPTIIGTVDASTTLSGGQSTGWRLVSAVVPNDAIGRAVMFVYLSLEMPTQNSITSFSVDDIQVGN